MRIRKIGSLHFAVVLLLIYPAARTMSELVGSEACLECHEAQYNEWKTSHHFHAMEVASEDSVLGNFANASFTHFGVTSLFFKKDGRFYVKTDNAMGELTEYEILYTFGYVPLQQYLIRFPDGRLQALSVSWDSRTKEEGGQRWFHLYPDEPIPHDDQLHWTAALQNWNSRCAICHSTNLKKNYDQATDTYETTWSEINVACEACHGSGANHLRWAETENSEVTNKGFEFSLDDRGTFATDANSPTLKRADGERPVTQVETCAFCHSRRQVIDEEPLGKRFSDVAQLSFLSEELYFPDGQILDEVYVYASFLQSRMHGKGVVCSDCHEPHGLKLRWEGNALCSRCHQADVFDTVEHHHHAEGTKASWCGSCHMQERTYMVVDPRFDHSFRVPDLPLSLELNVPDVCSGCHEDESSVWILEAMTKWYGEKAQPRYAHGKVLARARNNESLVADQLASIAEDPEASSIVRATALLELRRFPQREISETVIDALNSDDAMIRLGAVQSLEWLPAANRLPPLAAMLDDSSKAVRLAVAVLLASAPAEQIDRFGRQRLEKLFDEYTAAQRLDSDMFGSQLNLGVFYSDRGDPEHAEVAYSHALKLAPQYVPGLLNLADLYRATNRDEMAKQLLQQAIDIAPDEAPANYAMGLFYVRQKRVELALTYLKKAYELAPEAPRFAFVYSVGLQNTGQLEQAIEVLEQSLVEHDGDYQLMSTLAGFYREKGDFGKFSRLNARIKEL